MAAKIKVDQIETVDATDSITINNTVVMASGKTLPAASLTGALPAISGANLTNLPADATKLPLAGGTMTGNLVVTRGSGNAVTRFQGASNSQSSKLFVSHVSSGDGGLYYNSNYMDIFSYSDMRFNVGTANVSGTIGNQRMVIKNNGHVGIGTTSPAITESRQAGKFVTVYSTATNGSILELASNKNTDNDTVGIVSFINTENGDTGGPSRKYLAQIRAKVETNDSNAQDDSGGNLVFQTKADGGTIDDRLTITSAGNVGIGVTPDSEWHTGRTSLQIGTAGLTQHNSYPHGLDLIANGILKTSGEKQLNTSYPSNKLQLWNGTFLFKHEAAGNAAISWDTQLEITADGRAVSQFTANAWCAFNATGTPAIRDSHNVSSIGDNGTGWFYVYIDTDLANANSACVASASNANNTYRLLCATSVQVTTAVYVMCSGHSTSSSVAATDPEFVNVVVFGD